MVLQHLRFDGLITPEQERAWTLEQAMVNIEERRRKKVEEIKLSLERELRFSVVFRWEEYWDSLLESHVRRFLRILYGSLLWMFVLGIIGGILGIYLGGFIGGAIIYWISEKLWPLDSEG